MIFGAWDGAGLSEEPVQQEKEMVGSGGGAAWEVVAAAEKRKKLRRVKRGGGHRSSNEEEEEENEDGINGGGGEHPSRALIMRGGGRERQREHPFIVTEAGEVARGKKNGLDYLFHLYEQCHDFLAQVQNMAKERGEKCPTKVRTYYGYKLYTTHASSLILWLFYCGKTVVNHYNQ